MKPEVKMSEDDADESALSSADSQAATMKQDENNKSEAKYRLIDTAKYYIVEEDVSDEEDIDPKHYQNKSYQRYVCILF